MDHRPIARRTARWGAAPIGDGLWRFSLYAPGVELLELELSGHRLPMRAFPDGFHMIETPAEPGDQYRFCHGEACWPDPASRAQAGGVHDASVLVDPDAYRWTDDWSGRPWHEAVIYEMHVGSFTPEGTFRAAARRLRSLSELGITAVELMPVAQFAGNRGWGYDGVLPFAPHPAYGSPDDLRAFVAEAHRHGVMVFLDVVYNHFGPEGAYLHAIAPELFDARRKTPWGAGLDYSNPALRSFVRENATMWLDEYRMDGLRFDAVHQIVDETEPHLLEEVAAALRRLELGREVHLITEDERNIPDLREAGFDASWNDDFHHAVHCALTGEDFGYYAAFAADPIGDLALALERGHVEEGQPRAGDKPPRGRASGHLGPLAFVNAVQTHDQVGNRAQGERLLSLADPAGVRVAQALLLLSPFVPMLFMGEEAGETAPFLFFADFHGKLGRAVSKGRAREFRDHPAFAGTVPDPIDPATFEASRPFAGDPEAAEPWLRMTKECLDLRRRVVEPLLASGPWTGSAVRRTGDRSLSAEWRFPAGGYGIDLSLGAAGGQEGEGQVLYRIGRIGEDDHALALRHLS